MKPVSRPIATKQQLEEELLRGVQSGSTLMTPKEWQILRTTVEQAATFERKAL